MSTDAHARVRPVTDHRVHFFASEDGLVGAVGGYLTAAVRDGDTLIVIATREHRDRFSRAVTEAGVDVPAAERSGRLQLLDAVDTLARFTVDGEVDATAFSSVVGELVRDATARGRPVRLYGAMVAVLWARGDVNGALKLEGLWNDLATELPFSLVCGYPADLFDAAAVGTIADVCHAHSDVIAGAPDAAGAEIVQRFPRTPHAAHLARRFVRTTLEHWAVQDDLLEDALLVTSELVSNAVLHAASDVSVALTRTTGGVRVAVGDTSTAPPTARTPEPATLNGRGLAMVDAVARSWGHDLKASGKVVWADLRERDGG